MTSDATRTSRSSTGWDEVQAQAWVTQALRTEDVEDAWRLAAALIAQERPGARLVLDAGSGPGGYLAAVLDALPDARGLWFDGSTTMKQEAIRRLERFGDRVDYRIGDLTDLREAGDAETFDLVTSSRATHHLVVTDLATFYRDAATLLRGRADRTIWR